MAFLARASDSTIDYRIETPASLKLPRVSKAHDDVVGKKVRNAFLRTPAGFRPKRDVHHALKAITGTLGQGLCWIIDAEMASCFDTIPHDRLMKAAAERVVDHAVRVLKRSNRAKGFERPEHLDPF